MYKAFELEIESKSDIDFISITPNDINNYKDQSNNVRQSFTKNIRKKLQLKDKKGVVDVSALKELWFPQGTYNCFISHSHKDLGIANNLACWLKNEFGLNAFVDSTIWGYSDDLLYQIDDDYCLLENNGKNFFDYNKRNYTTTQIHIILVSALREMIDNCECVFFLNTDNSVSFDMSKEFTDSAWIFNELQTIRFIQKKLPKREVKSVVDKSIPINGNVPLFKYDVNKEIEKLAKMDIGTLVEWKNRYKRNKLNDIPIHPLDILYKVVKEEWRK